MAGEEARATRTVSVVALVLVLVAAGIVLAAESPFGAGSTSAATEVDSSARNGAEQRIGESVSGRPITVLRFGTAPKRLLVVAGVHGDEFGTAVAAQLIEVLRREPGVRPESVSVDVISCLNPDGSAAGTRANARGVDLNRNLPSADWSPRLDAKDPSNGSRLTSGAKAGSEPETQALLECLETGYDAVVSLHSSGGLVDWDGAQAEALASRIASASGLPTAHMAYQASIHGSMGRYLSERGIPLVTIELESPTLTGGIRDGILRCLEAR